MLSDKKHERTYLIYADVETLDKNHALKMMATTPQKC